MKNKRTKTGQKKHDTGVTKSAQWYKSRGYKVEVDLPGEKKPKNIDGFIPDLIAKKGHKEIVIEVETKQTANTDTDQQAAFKKYAARSSNRTFKKKVI
ncbi:hypothetical protein CL653_01910 [bacterium]|nr:hypothetical protein [bacterium]